MGADGVEAYPGCDDDARAIDTRMGTPSAVANRFDRALRARPRDEGLFGLIVRHLASGLKGRVVVAADRSRGRRSDPD